MEPVVVEFLGGTVEHALVTRAEIPNARPSEQGAADSSCCDLLVECAGVGFGVIARCL